MVQSLRSRLFPILLACVAAALLAPPARAGTANLGLPGATKNPIGGMTWGGFRLPVSDPRLDPPSAAFNLVHTAADRATVNSLLEQPRFKWFGSWVPLHTEHYNPGAYAAVRKYIRDVTGGHRSVGVGIGVFRLQPFEHAVCRRLPTLSEQRDYRAWIRELARGIGRTRTALLLQPDMPFVLCLPGHSDIDMKLIAWTARTLSAQPHTTVYIDAGAADWARAGAMASMLARSGVAAARGFALNLTHYDSTNRQIVYGRKILKGLAHRGIRGKTFLVNTAQNGRPFTTQAHWNEFMRADICATRHSRACVTLGRRPTTETGHARVDGFLWLGRPWMANARPRRPGEILQLVRTSPFF